MIFSWLLGLTFLISIFLQAVNLHRKTVERQKSWLSSVVHLTDSRLTHKNPIFLHGDIQLNLKGQL